MSTSAADTSLPPGMSRCRWCGAISPATALTCPSCGASAKRESHVTASGWVELPPIADMARLRIGRSTCQIEGSLVPVADFNLAEEDSVYFSHHSLLWKDAVVEVRRMPMDGAFTRMMAGLPIVMVDAVGPGHIAFSRDEPGETIAIPLQPGQGIDVREHLFLAATGQVAYAYFAPDVWFTTPGEHSDEFHYPVGQYMDRFVAHGQPGLLLLHASGNVFVRTLEAGQTLLVRAEAFIFKDPGVSMHLEIETPAQLAMGLISQRVYWVRLVGPGRVAVQSAYQSLHSYARINNQSQRLPFHPSMFKPPEPKPPKEHHTNPVVAEFEKKVAQLAINSTLSTLQIAHLIEDGRAIGLSAYDVKLMIHRHQHH